ncbi:competence type IV pilus minor pilin ComGF [Liquorilactobacillus uvarum]|uniref:competence type IV pilus minor pilin ComGF n=1 Tax=Liquorilactobacillus uvarum TaxID=303240 RepID=UPI00070F01CD|nr:competence type IV pilus minor pilin ComGF [Liquorilactobacillus uvarum]
MKLKLKIIKKMSGFTMIESVSALFITALAFSVLEIALKSSSTMIKQTKASDNYEWAQFVDLIGSDNLSLEYVTGENLIRFYSPTKEKIYRLFCEDKLIRMTGVESGYIPLLYDVNSFTTKYEDTTLTIMVEMKGQSYICHIVMPKREMGE